MYFLFIYTYILYFESFYASYLHMKWQKLAVEMMCRLPKGTLPGMWTLTEVEDDKTLTRWPTAILSYSFVNYFKILKQKDSTSLLFTVKEYCNLIGQLG